MLLFRVDGGVDKLDLGLATPSRDVEHILRLMALRLEGSGERLRCRIRVRGSGHACGDSGALGARRVACRLTEVESQPEALAQLIDRLRQRLGPASRAAASPAAKSYAGTCGACSAARHELAGRKAVRSPKPSTTDCARVLCCSCRSPKQAQVTALIPDGPPRRFRWRGVTYRSRRRKARSASRPNGGGEPKPNERDYYMVEDTEGRRFWLYRDGLYGGEALSRDGSCMGCSHERIRRTRRLHQFLVSARRLARARDGRPGRGAEARRDRRCRSQYAGRRRARPHRSQGGWHPAGRRARD